MLVALRWSTEHIRVPEFQFQLYSGFQVPAHEYPARQQLTAQVVGSLPYIKENQFGFSALVWACSNPNPAVAHMWGSEPADSRDVSSCSLCHQKREKKKANNYTETVGQSLWFLEKKNVDQHYYTIEFLLPQLNTQKG